MRLSNDRSVIEKELRELRRRLKSANLSERASYGVSISHRVRKLKSLEGNGKMETTEPHAGDSVRATAQSFIEEANRVAPHRTARVTIRAGGKTLASGTMELRSGVTVDELLDAEEKINAQTTLRVHFDVE